MRATLLWHACRTMSVLSLIQQTGHCARYPRHSLPPIKIKVCVNCPDSTLFCWYFKHFFYNFYSQLYIFFKIICFCFLTIVFIYHIKIKFKNNTCWFLLTRPSVPKALHISPPCLCILFPSSYSKELEWIKRLQWQ